MSRFRIFRKHTRWPRPITPYVSPHQERRRKKRKLTAERAQRRALRRAPFEAQMLIAREARAKRKK